MIASLIFSVVIGLIVSSVTGSSFIGFVAGVALFVCALPFTLLFSLVHSEVSYAQACADYRETMAEIAADERAEAAEDAADDRAMMHEYAEDERLKRLVKAVKKRRGDTYNDNRQVHLHGTKPW